MEVAKALQVRNWTLLGEPHIRANPKVQRILPTPKEVPKEETQPIIEVDKKPPVTGSAKDALNFFKKSEEGQ